MNIDRIVERRSEFSQSVQTVTEVTYFGPNSELACLSSSQPRPAEKQGPEFSGTNPIGLPAKGTKEMNRSLQSAPERKSDKIGDLAANLVADLGLANAVAVCRNNHWYGVLDRIVPTAAVGPPAHPSESS